VEQLTEALHIVPVPRILKACGDRRRSHCITYMLSPQPPPATLNEKGRTSLPAPFSQP
jgi:hypothetical protein